MLTILPKHSRGSYSPSSYQREQESRKNGGHLWLLLRRKRGPAPAARGLLPMKFFEKWFLPPNCASAAKRPSPDDPADQHCRHRTDADARRHTGGQQHRQVVDHRRGAQHDHGHGDLPQVVAHRPGHADA